MKSIEAYTDEKLALMGKATKGPWVMEPESRTPEIETVDGRRVTGLCNAAGDYDVEPNDAALITDSRNSRESELKALRVAVKALEEASQSLHLGFPVRAHGVVAAGLREVAALLGLDKETNDAS